jgi:uncharacterized protein (TIRG00374 family)
LWEFASAITPSVIGGTATAIFVLNKEGIKIGKSIAYVTLTAIMDNLFFIIAAPFGLYFATESSFFNTNRMLFGIEFSLSTFFFISYSLIAFYTLFMAFGIIINPRLFQKIIIGIVKFFRFSKKIRRKLFRMTFENIYASNELKNTHKSYWFKAIFSTIFVWCARYLMLNCLLAAYFDMSIYQHQEAFGKQLVLWVSKLISPTPGASGIAEVFMRELFGATLIISSITLLWRLLSYYLYLAMGAIFLPKWLNRIKI